jgi:hypothetical protein
MVLELTEKCIQLFKDNLSDPLPEEYDYNNLPLCAIDSIFSIGVRYESVKNTVNNFCSFINIDKKSKETQISTSYALKQMSEFTLVEITNNIFRNRQRTSTRNGILKAEAVLMFLELLKKYNLEYPSDLRNKSNLNDFEYDVKLIPGQKSGISLRYFYMLAGEINLIKPDRMIMRFLEESTNKKVSIEESQNLLLAVAESMCELGYLINAKKLDNLIWNYQRSKTNN